jgi:hypothetical protein
MPPHLTSTIACKARGQIRYSHTHRSRSAQNSRSHPSIAAAGRLLDAEATTSSSREDHCRLLCRNDCCGSMRDNDIDLEPDPRYKVTLC